MSTMLDQPEVTTPIPTTTLDRRRVAPGWVLPIVNAAAWVGLVSLVTAVAPEVDPDAPVDLLTVVISQVFWMSAVAGAIGLATRSRWAYSLTAIGGGALVAGAVACFAGGHTGAWIGVQALAGLGLAATGIASRLVTR